MTSEAYGFVVVVVVVTVVSFLVVSIFTAAESIFMPVSADIAGAGAIAGAAVSVAGVSFALQAATSTTATRARRFMWFS
jgi:hypothetical protein